MRSIAAIILSLLAFAAQPLAAQEIAYQTVDEQQVVWLDLGSDRFVAQTPPELPQGIAAYGPFRVLDASHAALVDVTDTHSPADFKAMLRDYPGIATIEMIDCPGTEDDLANLRLGRIIRARGIATYVPADGSVRSGAVELFLAGVSRRIDNGAEFAVHAWIDEDGRQAGDYPANAPENVKYLVYYRDMGMSADGARAFYAMTNAAPFQHARWLDAAQMRVWSRTEQAAGGQAPPVHHLANLDLPARLH